jgi:hypothetical protein
MRRKKLSCHAHSGQAQHIPRPTSRAGHSSPSWRSMNACFRPVLTAAMVGRQLAAHALARQGVRAVLGSLLARGWHHPAVKTAVARRAPPIGPVQRFAPKRARPQPPIDSHGAADLPSVGAAASALDCFGRWPPAPIGQVGWSRIHARLLHGDIAGPAAWGAGSSGEVASQTGPARSIGTGRRKTIARSAPSGSPIAHPGRQLRPRTPARRAG